MLWMAGEENDRDVCAALPKQCCAWGSLRPSTQGKAPAGFISDTTVLRTAGKGDGVGQVVLGNAPAGWSKDRAWDSLGGALADKKRAWGHVGTRS